MKNWSQKINWQPKQILQPFTEEEVQQIIKQALNKKQNVRVVGSAHSFNPLWVTNEVMVNLDNYQGLISVNKEKMQTTVKAGTKLHTLGNLLYKQGMAMENLGDIDKQSIGGTIGTGTHGTGLNFGTISTQVKALRFVNGVGEVVTCSETENVTLFKAAQVSLGVLGIITEITLQCVPAYRLQLVNKKQPLNEVIATFKDSIANNRNFEFYYFPKSPTAWTKTSNIVKDAPDNLNIFNYLTEYVLENYVYKIMCETARIVPTLSDGISRFSASAVSNVTKTYHSHKVYATPRLVRFNEMEYNVPIEHFEAACEEIQHTINTSKFNVIFPIEHRVVKADDAYLSPAYNRDAVYIACHVYNKKDYLPYFKALEKIFLKYDGRPHWAKIHTLTAKTFQQKYEMFDAFNAQRKQQDPLGIFLNEYLKRILIVE